MRTWCYPAWALENRYSTHLQVATKFCRSRRRVLRGAISVVCDSDHVGQVCQAADAIDFPKFIRDSSLSCRVEQLAVGMERSVERREPSRQELRYFRETMFRSGACSQVVSSQVEHIRKGANHAGTETDSAYLWRTY